MDGCLAAEMATDRKRNERGLLPVIGAVSARETTSDARRDVDSWFRLDDLGYRLSLRDRGDLRRWLTTTAVESDRFNRGRRLKASRMSSDNGNGNDNRRRVWCRRNVLD
ncbi:hypothetical protein V6N13_146549 [Hibiscus sabdariffa]|uniref:Uncharacterized protein n=1 Tax=Hibiscus sabdariffa TaxID=183260 RepID=A0ABR2TTA4_9ROSI